ncbi:MAG TPA: hypothetical protein VKV39_02045 [Candidatus Sulfotelmatobacter sp.]|nr:hypothetical protein [Candidatus Sulfotelmatobacter sp.]
MDITLGPWTAAKTINEKQRKPLADAMGDEAWNTAKKKDGFTPKQAEGGTPAKTGFTISGQVVQVGKQGSGIQVKLMFTLWADGTFSNIAPVPGQAVAEGSMGAEDALRAVTEAKVNQLLDAIKSGRATKAR